MALRHHFLLTALLSLTLLWIGLQAFKVTGELLHRTQLQSLEREAEALAAGLQDRDDLVLNIPARYRDDSGQRSLLLRPLAVPPQVDGWLNDWSGPPLMSVQQGQRALQLHAGLGPSHRVFAITIEEPEPRFGTLNQTRPNGDFIELTMWSSGSKQQWILNPFAPGTLKPEQVRGRLLTNSESPIRAAWQSSHMMHTVEIAIPLDLPIDRFNIVYQGEDTAGSDRLALSGTALEQPFWLLIDSDNARAHLQRIRTPASTISLIDRWGWPIATHQVETNPENSRVSWVLRRVQQSLLAQEAQPLPFIEHLSSGQIDLKAVSETIAHDPAWTSRDDVGDLEISVVRPILSNEEIVAYLVFKKSHLTSASSLYTEYFWICLLAFTAATAIVLAMLGCIGWLRSRISRLVASLGAHDVDINTSLGIGKGDELDQLIGRFSELRARLDSEKALVKDLGKTLTHELRTPIAMVSSSLESISTKLSADALDTAVRRAKSGITRLESMVTALSEAQQLERALASEQRKKTDLSRLLRELGAVYQNAFASYRFVVEIDTDPAEAEIDADAVVQAIDKLIDNARSYSIEEGEIALVLEKRGLWWRISIKNAGSPLPEGEPLRLFDPMVSHRQRNAGDKTHLGLGLHVVNLVARHHGGQPYAVNTEQGVAIGFTIEAKGRSMIKR